nr:hypothetical protein [Tanacetum cinerariifolium]
MIVLGLLEKDSLSKSQDDSDDESEVEEYPSHDFTGISSTGGGFSLEDDDLDCYDGYEAQESEDITVVRARETIRNQVVQWYRIKCFNCKEFGHFAKECMKPKHAKDYAYHKEKMMLCKQEEKGVLLNVEHGDWLDDTDEEPDEQELEAHYMYIEKIPEHSEQPKTINDTYVMETVDSNVIPNS